MENRAISAGRGGFTLPELVLTISLLSILLATMARGMSFMQAESRQLKWKADSVAETSILSRSLSNYVKNSYGIDYQSSDFSSDLGKVTVYDDRLERNRTEIYVERDPEKDVSRLMVRRNGGKPFALHSSSLFVKGFKVRGSPDPRSNAASLDDQPWLTFEIETRKRSIMESAVDDQFYSEREKVPITLKSTEVLRNYTPSSLKN